MKNIFVLVLLFTALLANAQQLVNHKGNDIFFSGINLAWMNFGSDLNNFNEETFVGALDEVANAGGNAIRWWLHINGKSTPTFKNDSVVGIDTVSLQNLKHALDLAAERGIVISLCLWSFDMLHGDLAPYYKDRNRLLLEDTIYTKAYINNALIPMVEYVKGHTAIMCWEIFNEPEGMTPVAGWNHVDDVGISVIQRVVNLCAGAIHRTDTTAKVSNGCWNAQALSDSVRKNYYRDDRLIAAGGDEDGTLDFYMMHYYPMWEDESTSPFHNPASHWGLDKPIVVAEFPAKGIVDFEEIERFAPKTELTSIEAYNYLFDNGYAGALSWTWTNHDGFGGVPDIEDALTSLKSTHPDTIVIPRDPQHDYLPIIVNNIEDTAVFINNDTLKLYANLQHIFTDEGKLIYTIDNDGPAIGYIDNDTLLSIAFIPDSGGVSIIKINATDTLGQTVTYPLGVFVVDTNTVNHFLTRTVDVSSTESDDYLRFYLIDGAPSTRWASMYEDDQWVIIDMISIEKLSRIRISWETAFAREYKLHYSMDKNTWIEFYHETYCKGYIDNIVFDQIEARYIKLECIQRATKWGFSAYEIEAYTDNGESVNIAPSARTKPHEQIFKADSDVDYYFSSFITDKNFDKLSYELRMADNSNFPAWFTFDPEFTHVTGKPNLDDVGRFTTILTGTDWFGAFAEYEITFIVQEPEPSGVDVLRNEDVFSYSNPASEYITVFVDENISDFRVIVYDETGRLLNGYTNVSEIDVSAFSEGIYYLQFISDDFTRTGKLLIVR